MVFKTLHQAAKDSDPWKTGNKWSEPGSRPSLLPSESFQTTVQWARGGIQTEPSGYRELSRRILESKETTAGCRREYLRRKLHSEFWELQKGLPQVFSRALNSTCVQGKYPKSWGKNHPKGLEKTVHHAHTGLRIVPVSTNQNGKLPNSQDTE